MGKQVPRVGVLAWFCVYSWHRARFWDPSQGLQIQNSAPFFLIHEFPVSVIDMQSSPLPHPCASSLLSTFYFQNQQFFIKSFHLKRKHKEALKLCGRHTTSKWHKTVLKNSYSELELMLWHLAGSKPQLQHSSTCSWSPPKAPRTWYSRMQ